MIGRKAQVAWPISAALLSSASILVTLVPAGEWAGRAPLAAILTALAAAAWGLGWRTAQAAGKKVLPTYVADQARMAASLLDAETRFRAFMDRSPFFSWMRDGSGQFVYGNEKFAECMGLPPHELRNARPAAARISSEYAERSQRDDLRVLELERPTENIEHVLLGDGTIRHWLVLRFLIRGQSGEVFVGGVALDLTERYAADEKLRASEQSLRSIMQSASEGIAVTDHEGKIVSWNHAAEKIFGYANEEILGHPLTMILSAAGCHEYTQGLAENPSTSQTLNVHGLRKGGEEFALEFSRSRLRRGSQSFATLILRDVTERRRLEAQLRLSEAEALETSRLKSEFLAHMSHEIRTPINGVIGMSDLLMDTRLDLDQTSYADAIQRSAKVLLDLINDILDFSKIEAGKLEIEKIDFDLGRVFEDTEKMLVYQAKAKGLQLSLQLMPGVPRALRGDPSRLRQVLGNLVANAIKFTARGNVRVIVSRDDREDQNAGVRLRFEVTDTGIGISARALARMFQPFSQADSSTSRQFGGTGLGLSICKRLVEQMGGEIGVRSREGEGSTFWFRMPFEISQSVNVLTGRPDSQLLPLPQGGVRILIAEDNQINQTIMIKQLEKMGISAKAVGNGHEVLEELGRVPYDLILMDCQMPGMDGYETSARIRAEANAPYRKIPIVAVTANAVQGDRDKCLSLGMNDYVSKPVNAGELNRVLNRWLNATVTSSSVIDMSMIEELRSLDGGEGEVLRQLIDMFAQSGRTRIAAIQKAYVAGDLKVVNSEAHTLKSSAANLGARSMAELCTQLENATTPALAAQASEVLNLLVTEFGQANLALNEILRDKGA